jgi:hypothetical protein
MRAIATPAIILAAVACSAVGSPRPASTSVSRGSCRPANTTSAALLSYVRRLATSSDSVLAIYRETFGVQRVAAERVQLVTENKVCAAAAIAYNRAIRDSTVPPTARAVWVVRVADRYFVKDPSFTVDDRVITVIFDRRFTEVVASF